jgi:cytochrome c oxidase assembly protein subunit 11
LNHLCWVLGQDAFADCPLTTLSPQKSNMSLYRENIKMVSKLAIVAAGMFAFGYALIPIYKHICEMTGINILSLSERQVPGNGAAGKDVKVGNTQVDYSRTITVEFDANARGPWDFKPAQRSVQVHPGELTTVMYQFQNVQNRCPSHSQLCAKSSSTALQ